MKRHIIIAILFISAVILTFVDHPSLKVLLLTKAHAAICILTLRHIFRKWNIKPSC